MNINDISTKTENIIIILLLGNLIISWNFNLVPFSFLYKIDSNGLILSIFFILFLGIVQSGKYESLKTIKYFILVLITSVVFILTQYSSYASIYHYYRNNPDNFFKLGQFICCIFPQNSLLSDLLVNFSEIIYISLAVLLLFIGLVKQQNLRSKLVCFNCGTQLADYDNCPICNFEQLLPERQKYFNGYQDILDKEINHKITYLLVSIASLLIFLNVVSGETSTSFGGFSLSGFLDFLTNIIILVTIVILIKLVNDGYKIIQLIRLKDLSYADIENNEAIQTKLQTYERTTRLSKMHEGQIGSLNYGLLFVIGSFILLSLPIIDLIYDIPKFSNSITSVFFLFVPLNSPFACSGYIGFSLIIVLLYVPTNIAYSWGMVVAENNIRRQENLDEKKKFGILILLLSIYFILLTFPLAIMIFYKISIRNAEPVVGLLLYETLATIVLIKQLTKTKNVFKWLGYFIMLLVVIIMGALISTLFLVLC